MMERKLKDSAIPMTPVSDLGSQPFTSSSDNELYPFGSMKSDSGEWISLKSVKVTGNIDGLLFSSTIRQEYKKETDKAIEIIYTFPIGWNTALLGMDASIGDKILHDELVKIAEAEEQCEEAIEKGDSAIMLQQSSAGLYTANLGNIKPGENVSIEIHCAKLLNYEQGRIRIAIPTVIGERYGDEHAPGGLAAHETAKVDIKANYSFDLELTVHGDMAKANIECPTHKITKKASDNELSVKLDSGARLDRDFILLLSNLSEESHALYAQDQDKWMATASFCPHMDNVDDNPLALKILVDCSGSMSGMSIQ